MKTTDFIVESIGEDADSMHKDHEVQMARQDCYYAAKNAIELHKLLGGVSEVQGLEGWVSEKLTLAADYLKTVKEYFEYEMMNAQQAMLPEFTMESADAQYKKMLGEINPHRYDSDEDYYNDLHGSGSGSGDVDPDEDDADYEDEPESHYEKHVRVNKLGENGSEDDYKDPEEADYGDEYQAMVRRVGQRAKEGPLKTVWDPVKRVYKNVPANQGEVDEATGEVNMKRWMKAFDRREDNNFHTENVYEMAKLVGTPEDVNVMKVLKKAATTTGLSDEQFAIRSEISKRLWPLVMQKYNASQSMSESQENNPVANAITRRILTQRTDILELYGPQRVTAAIDDVAEFVGDVEEIGSSDVSGWVRQVEKQLETSDRSRAAFKGMFGGDADELTKGLTIRKGMSEGKKKVSEMTAGGCSAGGFATVVGGKAGKPGTGIPKKIGNKPKRTTPQVGKGIY